MIHVVHKEGCHFTLDGILSDLASPPLKLWTYSSLLAKRIFPKGTYIFVDRERMDPWELRVYAALHQHLSQAGSAYQVLNNPGRVKNRYELLRLLFKEKINRFNVYLITECEMPSRYPVFIRRIHDHKPPLSDLLHNHHELVNALKELRDQNEPDEGLMITEYCAEPVMGNLFQKHSSFRVGDRVFYYHTMVDETWLVKFGMKKPYPEELCKDDLQNVISNAYVDQLRRAFDLANIEYGRADFGIVNGEVQIYEINTNPHMKPLSKMVFKNSIRTESIKLARNKLLEALSELDNIDVNAASASVFEHPLLKNEYSGLYQRKRVIQRQ